jgi:hypothetical protein
VIKRFFIQIDNIRSTTLVVRMTGSTLAAAHAIKLSVESGVAGKVLADVFMTVNAKRILLRSAESFVAGRAFRFKFGMRSDYLSGHDQRFDVLGSRRLAI